MKVCIILALIGLFLIIDSLFDILRKLGLKIPRKYTRYFAPSGFLFLVAGIYLNQLGWC